MAQISIFRPFRWDSVILVGTLFLALIAPTRAAGPTYAGYRIENIYILRRQIFDTTVPSENKLLYRNINRLHILTKESAVFHQLLFKKGDSFDPAIARETERALRRVLRLRGIHVRPVPVGPDTVDVIVETQDTWTTEPFIGVSGSGADKEFVVGIRERNLGGYGKTVGFIYRNEPDLITRSFSYQDPALLGTPLRLSGDYADTADGSSRSLIIEKPFSSSLTPFGFKTMGSYENVDSILYEDGIEVSRYTQEEREIGGNFKISLGSTAFFIQRLGLGYRFLHKELADQHAPNAIISDSIYHLFGPHFEWQKVNFITENKLRLYSRQEDINLGPTLEGDVGISQSRWVPGAENATFIQSQYSQGHLWRPGQFVLATMDLNARYENGWQNTQSRLDVEYYNKVQNWSTWAGRLSWEQILHPDPNSQLLLGGDSGLRGYPINQFAGNRLFVANIENRLFVIDEVFKFFGIGAVGFADAGYAWPQGTAVKMDDLRADYGAGLRFHLTRASLGQVIRLDVAWPTRSTDGKRSPVFTFGTSQVF
jgi:outer membrane protein assembly factor BamA